MEGRICGKWWRVGRVIILLTMNLGTDDVKTTMRLRCWKHLQILASLSFRYSTWGCQICGSNINDGPRNICWKPMACIVRQAGDAVRLLERLS